MVAVFLWDTIWSTRISVVSIPTQDHGRQAPSERSGFLVDSGSAVADRVVVSTILKGAAVFSRESKGAVTVTVTVTVAVAVARGRAGHVARAPIEHGGS